MKEITNITFAVHTELLEDYPLCRFDNIEQARKELISDDNASVITCEVSKKNEDGSFKIVQERIISAPRIWIKANRFIPEYDGMYLTHQVVRQDCGNMIKVQQVVNFSKGIWNINENARVTHFMIVLPPERTINLI